MYRSKSVIRLVLVGFALVALPLLLAILVAAYHVERLADQSHRAVLRAVQATQQVRILVEQLTDVERHARQYQVLAKPALLEVYADTHRKFQRTWRELSDKYLDLYQREQFGSLAEQEERLYRRIAAHEPGSVDGQAAIEEFPKLSRMARGLLAAGGELIDREAETMEASAGRAQRMMTWNLLGWIPIALITAVLFTGLVTRPIRQIKDAIRRLGRGNFADPIEVSGPLDLADLGLRLDWLRQRLLDLEQEKSRFLGHVSHELKTPLTAIREGSELLTEHIAGPLTEEQEEVAAILHENGIRLQELVENLLNFSAVGHSTALRLVPKIALAPLVRAVLARHKLAIKSKNLLLVADLEEAVLSGDEEKLGVIVDNLVSNAVKFTPAGGAITIRLRWSDSGDVVLEVRDTGPGFAEQDKGRAFEPFYQGGTPHDAQVRGTGLGLSIVKEYVRAHAGAVEIIDTQNCGAHLRVRLPAPHVTTALGHA